MSESAKTENGSVEMENTAEEKSDNFRYLAGLVNLASRLNATESVTGLLTTYARGLGEIWPGAGVRVCRIDTREKYLVPVDTDDFDTFPLKTSLLGNVAQSGESRMVSDLDDEPFYIRGREAPPGLTWKRAIVTTIRSKGAITHVAGIFFSEKTKVSENDLDILKRSVLILEPLINRWESQGTRLNAFLDIARAMATAVDTREPYMVGHGSRVSEFAQAAAAVHGLEKNFVERLGLAGLLHDLGRLGVPESILLRPGPLAREEFRIIHTHPVLSENFLSGVEYLDDVLPAIRHHHERYDGQGYPDGLEGDDIPLGARLLTVADAFDAMTSERPFRTAMSDRAALDELTCCSETQFDPILVEAFIRAYDDKLIISQNVLKSEDPLAAYRL